MRYSASRIQTFMECPLRAKFQYIDLLPRDRMHAAAIFGSCMHLALEKYNNGLDIKKTVKLFSDAWKDPIKFGFEEPGIWPKYQTHKGYMKAGKAALRAYDDKVTWRGRQVIATEHKFLVTLGEFELTGYVDHLELTKDKTGRKVLMVQDHKTGQAPTYAALGANIQFTVYDWASRQPEFWMGNGPDFPPMDQGEWHYEMAKDLPRLNVWHSVMNGKEYNAGERSQADFERLHRILQQITRANEHEVWIPNISGSTCGICPYTEPCRLPIHPEVEDAW